MDYFDKYKEAKKCLVQMVGQFYSYYLPKEIADELEIIYDKKDVKYNDKVELYFHEYKAEGLLAWQLLELKNKFVTFDDLCTKRSNIRNENRKDTDYQELYLRMSILLSDMVMHYYSKKIPISEAKRLGIKYNDYYDEDENMIEVCDHLFEGAGESAWQLLELKNPIIGKSIVSGIRDFYKDNLIINEHEKIKELKKLRR